MYIKNNKVVEKGSYSIYCKIKPYKRFYILGNGVLQNKILFGDIYTLNNDSEIAMFNNWIDNKLNSSIKDIELKVKKVTI